MNYKKENYRDILLSDLGLGLLQIKFNRPEHSNAFSQEMIEAFSHVVERASEDDDVKVLLVSGEGKNFCAGGDLNSMQDRTGMFEGDCAKLKDRYQRGVQKIPLAMEGFLKPSIALIHGAAVGAGFDISLMCDFRIGTLDSRYGESFIHLGLVPGIGGSYFLVRALGYAKALEISLLGEIFDAKQAHALGLLYKMVPAKDLVNEGMTLAKKLSENPTVASSYIKRAIKAAYRQNLPEQLELLSTYQAIVQNLDVHQQRVGKFLNRKRPS